MQLPELNSRQIRIAELLLIIVFVSIPLFFQFPFKINLFLAWEGAYRLSIGQVPFKDFSLPMGVGFWLIPALFFKIFGPTLFTLIKAQVFINLIGALAFRSILRKLGVQPAHVFLALLVYCISFIFVNFWPWYNHTVFIFELIAINFLIDHILQPNGKKKFIYLTITSFFLALAFFTKQDGGGLAIVTATVILIYDALTERKIKWLAIYAGISCVMFALFILPFVAYDFLYWFNVGQKPHNSRVNLGDILTDVFEGSQWIKFYLVALVLIVLLKFQNDKNYFSNKKEFILALFTFCILIQAMLVQVTSYIPHNVNIYFHSFGFAFIIAALSFNLKLERPLILAVVSLAILFWWSADYWRYGQRIIDRISPGLLAKDKSHDHVSKYTWFVADTTAPKKEIKWMTSNYKSFKNVLLPEETIKGIDAIMKLDIIQSKNLQVLNMSELTPLAYEIGFEPLTGQPMWYHKNVSMFQREVDMFCEKVNKHNYDLVLFEVIPNLNQFYPEEVRVCLQKNYKLVNSFQAPRDNVDNFIEVYVRGD